MATISTITSEGAFDKTVRSAINTNFSNLNTAVSGISTATASAGAATLNANIGVVTSEALTTAGLAAYTLTLTNDKIAATSVVIVSVQNGTNSQGTVVVGLVTPGAGSATIGIRNVHASQALNGTIKISFFVLN
jgi:hypothetical protein